jgi:hypothetical protein
MSEVSRPHLQRGTARGGDFESTRKARGFAMTERNVRAAVGTWLKANWRVLLYVPALLAAGAFAAWASFTAQTTLGIYVGFGSGRPWLLPAILDVAAYATTVAYMLRPNLARALVSGGFLTITALGNAQAHYFNPASADLVAPLEYAIAWGVAPPLVWFTVAHFMAYEMHPDAFSHFWPRRNKKDPEPELSSVERSEPTTKKAAKKTTSSNGGRRNSAGDSPESVAAWLTGQGFHPGDISRARLVDLRQAAGEPITEHRAREVLKVWTANGNGASELVS